MKKHVKIDNRIKCNVPLRFCLSDVLDALEELQSYCVQKQDGKTANDVRSLINVVHHGSSVWQLLYGMIFCFKLKNQQTCGISLDVVKSEIHTTQSFLQNYRQNGYNTVMVSAREIADVGVESAFVEKRKRNRNRMFDYESEDQSSELSQESQFKVNLFLHLVDHAIASLNDRFEQTHYVTEIFNFLLSQENLLQAFNENNILDACKTFHDKLGDINPFEMKEELERFVHAINENKESLKATKDFLNYICKKPLLEVCPNLCVVLPVVMTYSIFAASAERSFGKIKLIKTFHRSTTMDDRLTSLALISIESACVRSLDYNDIIDVFATAKARNKFLNIDTVLAVHAFAYLLNVQ